MADISSIFGGDFVPPKPPRIDHRPPEEQIIEAIADAGFVPPQHIVIDGKVHRFSSDGRKKGNSGWYIIHSGKIAAGAFGCWREGRTITWRQDIGRKLTQAEEMQHAQQVARAQKAAREERERRQEVVALTVSDIWSGASEASNDHPYLQSKGVLNHGLRVSGDGNLIVPLINATGELQSLQYLSSSGDKRYHSGGAVAGCRYTITGTGKTHYIAEGYSTAATIHEHTGATVHVAFSAGQISAVTGIVRAEHDGDIVIVADNDDSGTGQHKAQQAASEHRARVIVPPIAGMDANDYAQAGHDLNALLNPPADDWLISADDFASKPAPIKWLIKHWLQEQALIMVHGPSGGGKTFVVLDMCLHLAAGKSQWHGTKSNPCSVVYLAGEGHQGLRGRIAAWKQHYKAGILNMWLSSGGTDLNTIEGYNKTRQAIISLPDTPKLVVVDTLHRFLLGDENSAQDAKTMLDACNALQQEFGCTVLLVHHTGVSEDAQHRARGSSAWRGALDIEISVVPATDETPIQLIQRKSKDAELAHPEAITLQSVYIDGWFDDDGEQVGSAVAVSSEAPAKGNPKIEKFMADFMSAWQTSGSERVGNCHYVSRSALKEWLKDNVTDSDRTIKNSLDKSRKGSMIGVLIESGSIRPSGAGWIKIQSAEEAAEKLLGLAE